MADSSPAPDSIAAAQNPAIEPPPQPVLSPPPPAIQLSFRPAPAPSSAVTPQFTPVSYQTPDVPPPGVVPTPAVENVAHNPKKAPRYVIVGQPVRYAPPMSDGHPAMPQPPGVLRFPSPYTPMMGPAFPPRPLVGSHGSMFRPPVIPTNVYVGKISSTVENDFMLSLLELCGPVKNWKRPQDSTGTLKGFGFCELDSAEGVLCALRLLNNLRVDGQELKLNVNQTTQKYLERYVEKKIEDSKVKESTTEGSDKDGVSEAGSDTDKAVKSSEESLKPLSDEQKKDDSDMNKENPDAATFGDEDREADRVALEKLTGMIKDRESGEDGLKNDREDKSEDKKTAKSKRSSEPVRAGTGSPDRSRRHVRSRDRDRDLRREKKLERHETKREQKRAKRKKDREYRSREDERRYKTREKEWDSREREREQGRKRKREREKERAQERKWEILEQESHGDDGYSKKRIYKISDEERKRRQREKEEDLIDRLKEEEEIAETKMRAEEEEQKKQLEALKNATAPPDNFLERAILVNETNFENQGKTDQIQSFEQKPSPGTYEGEGILQNGTSDLSNSASDVRQNSDAPTKMLGFGLSGLGKRAAVPSFFNEDEDEDAHKEKKMRPLVAIGYSTEEQQAVQSSMSEAPPTHMAAAAEFVKRSSTSKEKPDMEKEKNRRSHDRSGQRDRDRHEEENNSFRVDSRKNNFERERSNKTKTPEKQKLWDAIQLIDTIPKTKDELFSSVINWAIYDQEHVDAGEMLERLLAIIDCEAETFVLKMWRMLIFEIRKVEAGLAPRSRA